MPNAFVDTNVLVYAAVEKTPLARKTTIARELLLQPGLHFSVQVLSEFVVNARHCKPRAKSAAGGGRKVSHLCGGERT